MIALKLIDPQASFNLPDAVCVSSKCCDTKLPTCRVSYACIIPQVTMVAAKKQQQASEWVPVIPIDNAPSPGTAKSVFVADLDLCVAADEKGLLYVLGNKCPPANQPLSFSLVSHAVVDIIAGWVAVVCDTTVGKEARVSGTHRTTRFQNWAY